MKNFKQYLLLIAFGVALFVGLSKYDVVLGLISSLFKIASPVLIGFLIAFILNVPMRGIERIIYRLFAKAKKPPKEKAVQVVALILTLLCVILVLLLVFRLVIPAVISSILSLYNTVVEKLPEWIDMLKERNIDTKMITQWMESIDIEKMINKVTKNASTFITEVVGFASTAVTSVTSFAMSFIISLYALLCKKDLCRQAKKLSQAFLKESVRNYLYHVASLINETYSKFLSGQCVEACILGTLIFIAFSIFNVPYAALTGVLTTVFAFVPFVGSFLSCFIGAFLVLIVDPSKVIVAVVVYLVVQFIENQFIYPHVVGTSVGLSSLWTLAAVLIGGKLFGVLGMIFFIPVMAVIIELLTEFTETTIAKKEKLKAIEIKNSEDEAHGE